MPTEIHTRRFDRFNQFLPREDRWYLLASLLLQLALGISFGHVYDMRIYMATGYLIATGQNPYIPQDLSAIFHNPAFQNITTIGYPPPWPMVLGLIYLSTYALIPNLLIYGLAIKLPIIAANIGMAYLVRWVLNDFKLERVVSRKAWIFILFNPFLLYFTTAWGQFDSLVALLTLLSLIMLYKGKVAASAILLALGIAFKPISIPVILVASVYLWGKPWRRLAYFLSILFTSTTILCIVPFILFDWDPGFVLSHWNAIFTVSGGMSLMTFYELVRNTYLLPGVWWLAGLFWLPAVLISALFIKFHEYSFTELLKKSLAMILVFFLTRTWLSEPNLALILPLVLILTSLDQLPKLALSATWALPLVFTIFNTSPPQLLFPILPELMGKLLHWMDMVRPARLMLRTVVVIPWQIMGWWMAARSLRKTTVL